MVRTWGVLTAFLLGVMIALPLAAQDTGAKADKPWTFYKLTMTVREMDGTKIINSRSYEFTQRSSEWGNLRVGSRVPVATGSGSSNLQFQYIDVGLKVDSRVQERDNDIAFDWRLELSSAAADPNPPGQPVIRNVSSTGQTLLTIGKPVVMTSVDDTNTTHKFVFEIMASKLK